MIVARAFPGPGSGQTGRARRSTREASFHGTHVAGIAAGDAGTTAPAGRTTRRSPGSRAWRRARGSATTASSTCRRRSGTSRTRRRSSPPSRPRCADGMDVINFSGGGPQTEPINDAMIETIRNVVTAGVVPVISAGNDRDDFGLGTAGSPGTAPDAISVAARLERPGLRAGADRGRARRARRACPACRSGRRRSRAIPTAGGRRDQTLVDVGSRHGDERRGRSTASSAAPSGDPNGSGNPLPRGSLAGTIALVSRGDCTFVVEGRARAGPAGATGSSSSTTARARRTSSRSRSSCRAG